MHRIEGVYDGFAADRSLAELVSDYRTWSQPSCLVSDNG